MGLDYGSKTVGVAISDPLGLTAQGIEIIRRKSENHLRQTLARIEELVAEYQVESIVLGLPKNMNNTIGDRAEKSREFKTMLERRTGLAVFMWDERLTTVEANRTMMEVGIRRENRHKYVDQLAANSGVDFHVDTLILHDGTADPLVLTAAAVEAAEKGTVLVTRELPETRSWKHLRRFEKGVWVP